MICKCSKPADTTYVNVTTYSDNGAKYKIDTPISILKSAAILKGLRN